MKIKRAHFKNFKRFTDLELKNFESETKLVVLVGSNGSGKSSVFDGFRLWHGQHDGRGVRFEQDYHHKIGRPNPKNWRHKVDIDFFSKLPQEEIKKKKLFYFRSAYRNQADFTIRNISSKGSDLDAPRVKRMIDNDSIVSDNYQRLMSNTIYGIYDEDNDSKTVKELREKFIGDIRTSLDNLFKNLNLKNIGDPFEEGSFYFEKGTSKRYPYKNLSGGEKAAFDLILDLILKKDAFDNTIFCIDEPELHMHTKLQSNLLDEIYSIIPDKSQLWIATHSIGMMKKAKELKKKSPWKVAFIDFHLNDFDKKVTLEPVEINRKYWQNILATALDDLSKLVAPSQVIICEGKPTQDSSSNSEFDASCYRNIFNNYSETDFISVGNSDNVKNDKLFVGQTIQTLTSGTDVIRLIDRDDRSKSEIQKLKNEGVKVLSRRNIESYLLDDDIIKILCNESGQLYKMYKALEIKEDALKNSVSRGNPKDDIKSAAGEIYVELKKELNLTACGNDTYTFLRDTIAPLLKPDTKAYQELENDIFD